MTRFSLFVALVVLVFAIVSSYFSKKKFYGEYPISQYVAADRVQKSKQYNIAAIRVRDDYLEIKIKDIGWIRAYLDRVYSKSAQQPIIKLFNSARNPIVILKEDRETYWIVDILLTVDDKTVNLFDWLLERKYILGKNNE